MLKIKDSVNLEELKKFGFDKCDDTYRYSSKKARDYIYESVIYLNDYERIVMIDKCNDKNDLNIIYDLIKANLVEKIEE